MVIVAEDGRIGDWAWGERTSSLELVWVWGMGVGGVEWM